LTVTFPLKVLVPDAPAVIPPDRAARTAAVRLNVRVAKTPLTVSVPPTVRLEATLRVTPALTVRLLSAWGALIVPPVVPATKVDVPAVNVPADELNDWKVIVEAFAVRVPLEAVVTVPLDVIGRFAAEVVRTAFPVGLGAVFWMVRLPERLRPRVDIAYVTPADAVVSKTTLANSGTLRLDPAKVIVWAEALLNVTVAVPADHEADVDASVQDPLTVHASEPNAM